MTLATDLDLQADLDAWDGLTEDPSEPCEPPADADQANRMLRRLRRIATQRAEVSRLAQVELDRIGQWATDMDRPLRQSAEWLERALVGWARATHRQDPQTKTLKLPYGEVAIRAPRPSIEAPTDQEALEALAAWRPSFVRRTTTADKQALQKACEPGEVVATRCRPDGTEETVRQVVLCETDMETGERLTSVLPGVHLVQASEPTVTVRVTP